jgi:hypothetical protein
VNAGIPPIVKLAERLRRDIEVAVQRWARYHKFAHGTVLRTKAMALAELTLRAWRDRARQREHVQQLVYDIDAMKQALQHGSECRMFASFAQYEAIYRIALDLGRQAGGWLKNHSLTTQNAPSRETPQRGQILSTRAASHCGAIR